MKIGIVKYNAGNIRSVQNSLIRFGVEPLLTDDSETLKTCDKVIFPGVGHAAAAMNSLRENKLDSVIVNLRQPVLGICLGLQLLCKHSIEGDTNCLGIFDADVKLFVTASPQARADRRFEELRGRGLDTIKPRVLAEMAERDRRDSERAAAPLKAAPDAFHLDTSDMDADAAFAAALAFVTRKGFRRAGP